MPASRLLAGLVEVGFKLTMAASSIREDAAHFLLSAHIVISAQAVLDDRVQSVPIPSIVIRTRSPDFRLKSSGGTMPVPVNKMTPLGKRLSRPSQSIRSSKRRAILAMLVSPAKILAPSRSISIRMPIDRAAASPRPA